MASEGQSHRDRRTSAVGAGRTVLPRRRTRRVVAVTKKKIVDDEFMAAAIGDVKWLEQSLRDGRSPTAMDKNVRQLYDNLSGGARCYFVPEQGLATIHLAALHGRLECLKLLIEKYKVDVDFPSSTGWRAVHLVINKETGKRAHKCLQYLLEQGADPSVMNDDSLTPVHQAASEGLVDCLQLLIDNRGVVDVIDVRGHRPIDLAKLWGHRKCARMLASVMWSQEKEFFAKEMRQLGQVTAKYWDFERDTAETKRAEQDFYGQVAFGNWIDDKGLPPKLKQMDFLSRPEQFPAKPSTTKSKTSTRSGEGTTTGSGFYRPNSKVAAPVAASEGLVDCLQLLIDNRGVVDVIDVRGHRPIDLAKLWGHRKCARSVSSYLHIARKGYIMLTMWSMGRRRKMIMNEVKIKAILYRVIYRKQQQHCLCPKYLSSFCVNTFDRKTVSSSDRDRCTIVCVSDPQTVSFRMLASVMWSQEKEFFAKEMRQLGQVTAKYWDFERDTAETKRAEQDFYGQVAFGNWIDDKGLPPKLKQMDFLSRPEQFPAKPSTTKSKTSTRSGEGTTTGSGFYRPNSKVAAPVVSSSKKEEILGGIQTTTQKVPVREQGLRPRTQPPPEIIEPPMSPPKSPASPRKDMKLIHTKEWKPFFTNIESEPKTDIFRPHEVRRSVEPEDNDPFSGLRRTKSQPITSHQGYDLAEVERPVTSGGLRMPVLPEEVIRRGLSRQRLPHERIKMPQEFKCVNIIDVQQKRLPEPEVRQGEAAMHLAQTLESNLFQLAVGDNRMNTGSSSTATSSTDIQYSREKVLNTMKRLQKPRPFPAMPGPDYVLNLSGTMGM
uniref:Uncharacterized protein n=1 Tax=Branchiostoma floridae TaxID=7739 RepID=C3Y3R6_BRAFL|eukprot:XP_002608932.1 hypothetical protein BRAFLDRAFT_85494 [Branchiostoma floridae]